MAAFLNSTDQLRTVNWGRSYCWDIRIPTAPHPFNTWFPASDCVEAGVIGVTAKVLDGPDTDYKLPISGNSSQIQITFNDDQSNSLYNWLYNWSQQIVDETGVSYLADCVRDIHIARLNEQRRVIAVNFYKVFIDGTLDFTNNSQSDVRTYSAVFQVVESNLQGNQTWQEQLTSATTSLLRNLR